VGYSIFLKEVDNPKDLGARPFKNKKITEIVKKPQNPL